VKLLKVTFLLTLVFQLENISYSQNIYTVDYNQSVKHRKLPKSIKIDTSQVESFNKEIKDLKFVLIELGYFLHEVHIQDSIRKINVHLNEKFNRIVLIDSSDFKSNILIKNSKPFYFSPKKLANYLKEKTDKYVNNGYPFAHVFLDSTSIDSLTIKATLHISKGNYCVLNKIHVKGDSSISLNTVQSIIGISIGEPYIEDKVVRIDQRIEQNSFINKIKPAEILYTKEGFEIFLYLKSDKVSFLRGAVGLQPNPVSQKMSLTGELNLKLENSLKKGELLKLNWRSIKPQTQRLNIDIKYPFLFQSPFGVASNFLLYKRDSTFLDLNAEVNVSYTLKSGVRFRAHYKYINSNVLSGAENSTEFQFLSSYSTNSYGISIEKSEMDNIVNPSKGRVFNAKLYLGQRTLHSDSLSVSNMTYSGHMNYREYIPFLKRNVLVIGGSFDFYSSPTIYQNELSRFGGLNTLRGFNEEELFSSTKGQITIEYRFLLDQNSNIFIFYDQCMYENNSLSYYNDNPFGFGAGISFGSKIGVFNITYALGKQFTNSIDFRSSKIHFGYIAYF
jgi:outer membrane translocation and assembly module TamA